MRVPSCLSLPLTLSLAVLLAVFACLSMAPSARASSLTGQLQFAEGTYKINVGDLLSINVYNQPDLSHNSILVRADGNASFNGIGEVQVAGKTIREVTYLLESQMRELVREPRITLTVTESKPPTVYLAGAVIRPGMLQANGGGNQSAPSLDSSTSTSSSSSSNNNSNGGSASTGRMDFRLSSVLAMGGGVKLNADLANVMITRDGMPYKTVNLWSLLKEGNNEADIMLQNGDSVYIPELPEQALDDETYNLLLSSSIGPRIFPVRIIGEVKNPGVYELNGQSPYLNSAIAKGGGYIPGANRKVVAVRRFTAKDKFATLTIDPNKHDFTLRPNDVIYISELKIYKAGRFGEAASRVLAPFTSAASTVFGFALLGGL